MPNWIVRLNHRKSSDSLSYEKSLKCVVWGNEFTDTLCIQTYTEENFHFYMQLVQNVKQININALMWHWDAEVVYKTQDFGKLRYYCFKRKFLKIKCQELKHLSEGIEFFCGF